MKNFPLTCCYAPAFRSATRNEAAYAPQQVSGPTHAQPTTITSRSFLQNLTHITPPRMGDPARRRRLPSAAVGRKDSAVTG